MARPFKLSLQPVDYQLTVHYNNYREHYGQGAFETHLGLLKKNPEILSLQREYALMYGLIGHYGYHKVMSFINEVINYRAA